MADPMSNSPHRYGSIVSNIGAALVGGPGIVPGANIGRVIRLERSRQNAPDVTRSGNRLV